MMGEVVGEVVGEMVAAVRERRGDRSPPLPKNSEIRNRKARTPVAVLLTAHE